MSRNQRGPVILFVVSILLILVVMELDADRTRLQRNLEAAENATGMVAIEVPLSSRRSDDGLFEKDGQRWVCLIKERPHEIIIYGCRKVEGGTPK